MGYTRPPFQGYPYTLFSDHMGGMPPSLERLSVDRMKPSNVREQERRERRQMGCVHSFILRVIHPRISYSFILRVIHPRIEVLWAIPALRFKALTLHFQVIWAGCHQALSALVSIAWSRPR